jgi:hypothetical protein
VSFLRTKHVKIVIASLIPNNRFEVIGNGLDVFFKKVEYKVSFQEMAVIFTREVEINTGIL